MYSVYSISADILLNFAYSADSNNMCHNNNNFNKNNKNDNNPSKPHGTSKSKSVNPVESAIFLLLRCLFTIALLNNTILVTAGCRDKSLANGVNSIETRSSTFRQIRENVRDVPDHLVERNSFREEHLRRERRRILDLLDLKEPPVISPGEEEIAKYVAEIESLAKPRRGVHVDGLISSEVEGPGEEKSTERSQFYIVGKEDIYCSTSNWRCYRYDTQNSFDASTTKIIETSLHIGRFVRNEDAKIEIFVGGKWKSLGRLRLNAVMRLNDFLKEYSHNVLVHALPLMRISCSHECLQSLSPVVSLQLEIDERIRKRRSTGEECDHGGCCLRSFYFNFSDNSWNKWIIKPEGYNINYCSGHCQVEHQFDSARDIMANLARLGSDSGRLSGNPPCCTPTAYHSLKITYTTGFGIYREKILKDIIVRECGCRQ